MRARLTAKCAPKPRKHRRKRRLSFYRSPDREPIPAPLAIANSTPLCVYCGGLGLARNGVSPCTCALRRISRRTAARYRYLEEFAGLIRGSNNWRLVERRALWLADVAIAARPFPLWSRVRLEGERRPAEEWRASNGALNVADENLGRALAIAGMWP